jgi:hypothetical protein
MSTMVSIGIYAPKPAENRDSCGKVSYPMSGRDRAAAQLTVPFTAWAMA